MNRALDVYLHERPCGQLLQDDSGSLSFIYHSNYLEKDAMPVSVAMPIREDPYTDGIVRPFFSGLLPDERARMTLATALGVSRDNAFGMLEIIGGECAGAMTLLPAGTPLPEPGSHKPEPLSDQALAETLTLLRQRPLLGGEKGVRLSLAGAQDKLAVCLVNGRIALARDGRPTTHILKPFIENLHDTVENEWFCMKLASLVGLNVPAVSRGRVEDFHYLLVERFDRYAENNGSIRRHHQEDFCQALSIAPEIKYEAEGGPGIAAMDSLIRRFTQRPIADLLALRRMLIFHYLIGNADAHAKNYALLYRQNVPELAPVYDALCTALYSRLSKNMAMAIGGRSLPDTIHRNHWFSLVPDTKAAKHLLTKEIAEVTEKVQEAADSLIAQAKADGDFHNLFNDIRKVISKRASFLARAFSV